MKTNDQARCPQCNARLTAATALEGSPRPSVGDPTVCGYCALALVFTDGLDVRRMTDLDRLAYPYETIDEIARAQRLVRHHRSRS